MRLDAGKSGSFVFLAINLLLNIHVNDLGLKISDKELVYFTLHRREFRMVAYNMHLTDFLMARLNS